MSDEIIINIVPSASDNIQVNTSTSPTDVNVSASGSGVMSVNGRYGDIVLTKNDVGLNQVDNTSDLNKPLSLASLSAFNNINSSVVPNSANWNQAYSNLVSNSGFYLSGVDLAFLSVSGNWNSVYNNVNSLSSKWTNDFLPLTGGTLNNAQIYYGSTLAFIQNGEIDDGLRFTDAPNGFDFINYSNDIKRSLSLQAVDNIYLNPTAGGGSGYVNIQGTLSADDIIGTDSDRWDSVYNNVNSTSANITNYLPVSGGVVASLSTAQLTSSRISFSDLTFTGNSFYATASARCSFVEVRVGNVLKYLPLYDITKAIIYYVDFEGPTEVKPAYASGNVTLSGISWNLTEALIGTETNERIFGARSARLRGYNTSAMTMLADKADGISNINFLYRSYINSLGSPDLTQVMWNVEYSTDTGTTWLTAGTFTATPTTQTFNAIINVTAPARIRFRTNATGTSNRRANVDNITINPYT